MKVLNTPADYQKWREENRSFSVGFVPTMGALHQGHASLLAESKKQVQKTVLSIFVNPTQFNDKKDFENYPITIDEDLKLAEELNVDVVFLPEYKDLYADEYRFKICESDFSKRLCGAHRPGHFDGVLTVVMKLFQIIQPTKAYFGEKDFQQLSLIKKMSETFFLPLQVVAVPTMRESSGLAMSSRNRRLSKQGREFAAHIYKTLVEKKDREECLNELKRLNFEVEYLEDYENRRYVAVHLEGVRLIDNVQI